MKNIGGVWLPDHEEHLVEWMRKKNQVVDGKLTYQLDKQQAALAHVKSWRVAVDVGAHCGLWSMHLVKRFSQVWAFEPVAEHRECFNANVKAVGENIPCLVACALGEAPGKVRMQTAHTSSGDTRIGGAGDIDLKRLDDFDLQNVDFIKLDCEGYELFALRGAEATLKRCRPCVIVEQKPGRGQHFGLAERGAVDYLQGLGAKLRREMGGDFILSWDA